MKKALIVTPLNLVSKSMHSHRAAQGVIYADQLNEASHITGMSVHINMSGILYKDNYNDYDAMYIYHGNDWGGSINLFGGIKNYANINNFVNFSKFKGKVYSLVIECPDYYGMMKEKIDDAKAKGKEYNPGWDETDWDNLKRICETAETIDPNKIVSYTSIAAGDSHAISMYRPSWQVNSVPFKTLHGALKEGLESFIGDNAEKGWDNIEFYFGNIDVRHHLLRQSDPKQATIELVEEYVKQAQEIADKYNAKVKLYELLPIENESRKLPKTGFYKKTPFFGSWAERNEIRKLFREEIRKRQSDNVMLYEWVGAMINSVGELDFDCMEKPQSVHLSRQWYPHWQGYQYSMAPYREYIPQIEASKNSLESFF